MKNTLPIALLCALLAAGCAPKRLSAPQLYDFGVAPDTQPLSAAVNVTGVQAPDWLARTDMLYRLAYRDPRSIEPYAMSRWAGTPADLLTLRLRRAFEPVPPRRAQCILQIRLEEFSQVFDAPDSSRTVLQVQSSLQETGGIRRLENRAVRLERRTPTPDAPGAAAAFAALADELTEAMRDWVADRGYCQ